MATENPRVWFKSISLENVRSFGTKQTISFTDKEGNAARWNVILGDNGTGKTTVLKGACIVSGVVEDKEIIPMLRNGETPFFKGVIDKGGESVELRSSIRLQAHRHFGPFVLSSGLSYNRMALKDSLIIYAYGAARRVGSNENRQDQINTTANLFDESSQLLGAESWLLEAELNSLKRSTAVDYYKIVKKALMSLFLDEVEEIKSKRYYGSTPVFFETKYGDVMMSELNLGYKTLIAWVVDFARGLFNQYPDSPNPLSEPAICIVDEIDLHLHPKFQRTIIKFLTDTFKNTQFIVTAHSPLIVQSAEDANIILLKREGNETHVADGIDVHNWRVDQILSSDLFGSISARPPEVEDKMQRRRSLILKDNRTKKEQQELTKLDEDLGQLTASESEEALKALELIGKVLSK